MPLPAIIALILVFALLAGLIPPIVMYNRFISQRTLIDESWHDIDVELTRRHDLIPNLVATVKGYASHEQQVLDTLVAARESAAAAKSDGPAQRGEIEKQLGDALNTVVARAEAYPDLKASENFLQLQNELTNTEDRLAAARRFYNGNVRAYNIRVKTFPSNLIASRNNFTEREFFEADTAARAVPSAEV